MAETTGCQNTQGTAPEFLPFKEKEKDTETARKGQLTINRQLASGQLPDNSSFDSVLPEYYDRAIFRQRAARIRLAQYVGCL